jgi:signal transduction histidine kinase/ActR/RegA family two-component response regulator
MSDLDSAIFRRTLFRAIVLQPLLLGTVAALLLWQIDRVIAMLGWVAPPSPVIEEAHKVRELLVNMEFGLLGYAKSGDRDLANHYVEASRTFGDAMWQLERRVATEARPLQEKAVERLASAYPALERAAKSLLATEQSAEVTPPSMFAASLAMDAMKSAIVSLIDAEYAEQTLRLRDRRRTVRLAIGISLFATLCLGFGIAFAARRRLLALSRTYADAVADQRLRTDALRAAQAHAEAANRAKDDFLATVSHELRSPLNAVLTAAELLKVKGLDETRTRRALELIDRNVKRQARLIEDLLDVSRIVSGKLTIDSGILELEPIVREAVQGVRPAAAALKLEIDMSLAGRPVYVRGDHGRLLQIFTNILANAVKFTGEGGQVTVSLAVDGEDAEVRVTDTGIGIPADVLPKIFDRFEQADSSITRKHGGLGLGLAIARHLVALHGGMIRAESDGANRGATFRVRLPMAKPLALAPAEASGNGAAEAAAHSLANTRILVVDDDPDARDSLAMLLGIHGGRVSRATSVREALTMLDESSADVVLTDIAMPEADGYELLREIRARDVARGVRRPVIAVTAMASAEDRARLIGAGFDLHVTKPIDPRELIAAVAAVTQPSAEGARRASV